jgi:acyl carrier protein
MTAQEIRDRLVREIAAASALPTERVDSREPFASYGISSIEAVYLVGKLESLLGLPLEATLFWDYPTIDSLAKYLASEVAK